MSLDNAQSAVTYISISSDSDGPSWGIPLMNSSEFLEMDPYEDVAQHGQEDPEEDPSEEHEPEDNDDDPEEDPNEEHELEDEDTMEPSESFDETELSEQDEIAIPPPPSRHCGARIHVRPQTPIAASTQALIDAFAAGSSPFPLPPTSPAYDQAPLGHRAAMIHMRDDIPEEDMPPRRRFVLIAPSPGCDVAESSAAARAPRSQYNFVDTAFELRMMNSIEEVNLRVSYQAQVHRQESKYFYTQLHDAQTNRRDNRLEIDVVRGQRTAYEIELHERRGSCSHSDVRIYTLEARARTDMVEDASSSWTLKKKLTDKYYPKGEIKKLEIKLWNLRVKGNDVAAYTQRFQELALICTKFLADETEKVDKYISGLLDNIHGNVMSARPKTLDETIESILGTYLCAPSVIIITLGNVHPSVKNTRGHIKKNCPKLKSHRNGSENGVAQGRAYALGGRDASPNSNVFMGTFLLNNRYTKILFDTSADRSFVSTTFSALIDITPTTLENHYDVELVDGKIIGVNTIIYGFTLNFMNHPFNIDLMLILLGSFDVIIGMYWLTKYHGVIICDEKIVHAQEYLSKGCNVFLAYITTKEAKDKSEEKRFEDVPIVRDFPVVFPEYLSGIPPARQVEFQIDLVPGLAGYYRRFIEGFSKIAKSMTKLTQKNVKFDWGEKEEVAFQLIKQKLCSAPILALPKGSENFIVYCDASYKGKANVVADALSRKERSRPIRVRALVMTMV
nr:hypothetical protein [Tanacetum cinerariifolium]